MYWSRRARYSSCEGAVSRDRDSGVMSSNLAGCVHDVKHAGDSIHLYSLAIGIFDRGIVLWGA